MINVINKVKVLEVDRQGCKDGYSLEIKNNWSSDKMIDICVDGKRYTVSARDLKAAIENATNVNRY